MSGQLQGLVDRAGQIGGDTNSFKTIYGDTTRQGIDQLKSVGAEGSAGVPALSNVVGGSGMGFGSGLDQLMRTADGGMYGNPHMNANLNRAMDETQSRVNGMFSGAGRTGSGANQYAMSRGLSDTASGVLMDQYNKERQNQLGAANTLFGGGFTGAGMANQLDQARLFGANTTLQAGGLEDQMANDARTAPMRALQWQNELVRPIAGMGNTTNGTQTTQTQSSPLQTALGIGLGAASMFGSGGLFPGVGAGLGGMLGLGGGGGTFAQGWNGAPYSGGSAALPWQGR